MIRNQQVLGSSPSAGSSFSWSVPRSGSSVSDFDRTHIQICYSSLLPAPRVTGAYGSRLSSAQAARNHDTSRLGSQYETFTLLLTPTALTCSGD
jgi:hypothetical protein